MTVAILTTSPAPHATDVSPTTPIVLAARSDGTVLAASVAYDADAALTYAVAAGYPTTTVLRPAYRVASVVVGGYVLFTVYPRRVSVPGAVHALAFSVGDGGAPATLTSTFQTADVGSSLVDLAFRATRVDQAFATTPALDFYRASLIGLLRTRPAVASLVQLFYRVYYSELRAFIRYLATPPALLDQLDELVSADVGSVQAVDAGLLLAALWDAALGDLQALGARPDQLQPLRAAMASSYPQERVAAACAAVLAGAALYARAEALLSPVLG